MSVSENVSRFGWTKRSEQAAVLLAEDALKDAEIASEVGVNPRTLYRWKQHPDFQAKVQEHVARLEAEALKLPIARRRARLANLNDRLDRLKRVMEARAQEYAEIPGGSTGLLVKQIKSVGFGENNQVIEEYAVDAAMLREMRAHEEQAAKELGQWSEKHEHSVTLTLADLAKRVSEHEHADG